MAAVELSQFDYIQLLEEVESRVSDAINNKFYYYRNAPNSFSAQEADEECDDLYQAKKLLARLEVLLEGEIV